MFTSYSPILLGKKSDCVITTYFFNLGYLIAKTTLAGDLATACDERDKYSVKK